MSVGDWRQRGSLGFLFFYVVILSLFIWARSPPLPAGCVWEQVSRIPGWAVYMDLSCTMLLQARPTQSSVMWFITGPGVSSS